MTRFTVALIFLITCIPFLLIACTQESNTTAFRAQLTPIQNAEVPANATGSATLILDETNRRVTLNGSYSNLSEASIGAAIYAENTNGTIKNFTATEVTQGAGTLSGTWENVNSIHISDLTASTYLLAVKTAKNPTGEILGKLELQ